MIAAQGSSEDGPLHFVVFDVKRMDTTGLQMGAGSNSNIPDDVALRLSRAWEFLSGANVVFDPITDGGVHPSFTEFSIFMPLNVIAPHQVAGIGVLLHREDAQRVASHMFELPETELAEADLQDACCEVCNVFSDCVAAHVGGDSDVIIGLPYRANTQQFTVISQESTLAYKYQCTPTSQTLTVLIYNVFLAAQVN